jgi:enoyl-CoA hydratase
VPELAVGVPFPALPLEIMRFATPPQMLQELVYRAKTYTPGDALARGLVDEIVPASTLIDHTCQIAATLAAIPQEAFRITKRALRQPVIDRLAATGAELDEEVRRFWVSEGAVAAIERYLAKTIPKTRSS